MATDLKPVKVVLTAYDLESILGVLSEMVKMKGHGLGYSLNYNLHLGKKLLTDFNERLGAAKDEFYVKGEDGSVKKFIQLMNGELIEYKDGIQLQPGQNIVGKIEEDRVLEANEMLTEFSNELLNVDFKQFDEKKLNEAFENHIFDGIDLTPLFDTLIN